MEVGSRNFVKLEFPSLSENVNFARTAVAAFASQLDFTLVEIEEIRVAVSEAVSNAVIHAYKGSTGIILLRAELVDGRLDIWVKDQGKGIPDLDWASQAGNTTEEDRMGFGLVFIKEYMDQVEIVSAPNEGTRLRMVKTPEHVAARH